MVTAVVKIGGSVLSLPDLPWRLRHLFDLLRDNNLLCVTGGGQPADAVRQWNLVHNLSEEVAHWLAIDSMKLTARLIETLLPEATLAHTKTEVSECWSQRLIPVIDAPALVRTLERNATVELPHSWDATSDTIAAWLAREWPADRLVLIKSVDAPGTRADLSKSDAVDTCLPDMLSADLELLWCNLTKPVSVTAIR